MKYHEEHNWDECYRCPKKGNTIACLLNPCKVREEHFNRQIRKWHKEWVAERSCFACVHCKHRTEYEMGGETSYPYCDLHDTDTYFNQEDGKTCKNWVESEVPEFAKKEK